jgi:hypothetical protein
MTLLTSKKIYEHIGFLKSKSKAAVAHATERHDFPNAQGQGGKMTWPISILGREKPEKHAPFPLIQAGKNGGFEILLFFGSQR